MVATVSPVKKFAKDGMSRAWRSYSVFKVLLIVCQLFCAAPILNHTIAAKLHCVWCTVVLLSIFSATYSQEGLLKINMSTIQKALYMSEYVANNGLVLLAIMSSYHHRKCYKTFPERIKEIERRTQIYQLKTPQEIDRKGMIMTITGAVFYTATLFTDFFYNSNVLLFIRSSTVYILPNITISLVIGQYWVLIKLVASGHSELNSILCKLNDRHSRQAVPYTLLAEVVKGQGKPRWDVASLLDDLRDIFAHLDTLIGDVNAVFGLTITVNFLASFLALSIQIFVFYKISEQGAVRQWSLMIYTLLWIVLHAGKYISILQVNSCVLDEKAKTGLVLSDLEAAETRTEDAINRFLMQLVAKNSAQVACGMVELDIVFLGGVMSALSIYVIFLIQVDLGEITLMTRAETNVTTPKNMF